MDALINIDVQNTKNYIIPIFVPHYGCRHRCVFCNQKKITAQMVPVTPTAVAGIINRALAGITRPRRIEVAFYGGSFTALDIDTQSSLLQPARDALLTGKIHAIRLSTRPDAIDENILRNLADFKVGTIELGVQSLDDKVLKTAARGHDSHDVFQAARLIRATGIACGIQLMPGLPGEDWASLIATAGQAVLLAPDFARIYPAVVIAGTELAAWYETGAYRPLSLEEAVSRTAYLKLLFKRNNIPIIRTGLQATTELDAGGAVIAGPYHPAFGEMADAYLFYIMIAHFLEQVARENPPDRIVVRHHPRDASKVRGVGLENIKRLKNNYALRQIIFTPGDTQHGELLIEYDFRQHKITPEMINLI